jgi:DNA-binding LacI/PurR family transcriptional regulator
MRRLGLEDRATVVAGDHTEAAGARAAALLLAQPTRPTAVVASNDRCAVGLLDAVRRAGVAVPQSLSVVGYDDSTISRLAHVDLTTVNQDPRAQAEHAVAVAVERLDGERTTSREVVLTPRLVVRGSTAPPPT